MAVEAINFKKTTETVELSTVLGTITEGRRLAYQLACLAAEVDATLARVQGPLATRIEANRLRSARHRAKTLPIANGNGNGNGHHDVALKLTAHGPMLVCKRCGKAVAR